MTMTQCMLQPGSPKLTVLWYLAKLNDITMSWGEGAGTVGGSLASYSSDLPMDLTDFCNIANHQY